jgi:hypothetical protein
MEKKMMMEDEKFPSPRTLQKILCTSIVILTCALIAIAMLIYVDIEKASRKTRIECQVFYLRNRGVSDASFNSVDEFHGTEDWCRTRMHNKIGEIENEAQQRWNQLSGHRSYTICMRMQLISDPIYINTVLLTEILEFTRVSWSFWTFFERNERFKIFREKLRFQETEALKYCRGDGLIIDGGSGDGIEGSGFDDDEDSREVEVRRLSKRSISSNNNDLYFDES